MSQHEQDRRDARAGRGRVLHWLHDRFYDGFYRSLAGPATVDNALQGCDEEARRQWQRDLENRKRYTREQRERKRAARELDRQG